MSIILSTNAFSQTGVGVGFYSTGTEAGFGFRSEKIHLLVPMHKNQTKPETK
jgi:hypothetical protein